MDTWKFYDITHVNMWYAIPQARKNWRFSWNFCASRLTRRSG